jgi:exonuclease SbcC
VLPANTIKNENGGFMNPIKMKIDGFLSYKDPCEIDFTGIDLACISGQNGAGKSSLLDAITWVVFGQARKRDDSIINLSCDEANVSMEFEYEANIYKIQRIKHRNKSTVVEFQIKTSNGDWKPLTEKTVRETEAKIKESLKLDFDTFINASFFLQGKADQFTQQKPSDRKRILSNILGLEDWEVYRETTVSQRKKQEGNIALMDGRLQEIRNELNEEDERKQKLSELKTLLETVSELRNKNWH